MKSDNEYGMKMTLDIDSGKVEEAMAEYGVKTKTEVIDLALQELLRRKAVERAVRLQYGKFPRSAEKPGAGEAGETASASCARSLIPLSGSITLGES